MPNDDRVPRPIRLLIALLRRGLRPPAAASFDRLARALAHEAPGRALPLALVRLRRHLRDAERAPVSERARAPRLPDGAGRGR